MNGLPGTATRLVLISVSDKTGIVEFARKLNALGFAILSTGGTAKTLSDAGLEVTEVSDHTGFPEMMAGRVKTLHPKIHGGLLGRDDLDQAVMASHGIPRIHLAVINLYPFEVVTSKPDCRLEEAVENIDIGGPAMVRSAAKNFAAVGIVTSPDQYPAVAKELEQGQGDLSLAYRFELAVAAFNRIAQYDNAISSYLSSVDLQGTRKQFPQQVSASYEKVIDLRYGENPHQQAAWYRDLGTPPTGLASARQLQGKELSFNNIADADAAWACVQQFTSPACVIVKHANPCGAALDVNVQAAYEKAYATDPTSAFGGIIAFNGHLDAATATTIIGRQFVEVLIASEISQPAREVLLQKPNIRVLEIPQSTPAAQMDFKRIGGGMLLQTGDDAVIRREDCRVVTRRTPTESEWNDLLFSWSVVKQVKSNAIVFALGGQTRGIGAGQMSRVDSARIARWKAAEAGLELPGSAMASDAFFPFRDGIDNAADAGIASVIQPGGSMRDEEVITAADEFGIAMVFTGIRHFRH